jgi:hypothetical protein
MKTIFFSLVMFVGILAGAQPSSTLANLGMANGAFTFTPIPLTNQVPFTNTVVSSTNGAGLQLSNVVTLLLTLQTNIEQTLLVLDLVQSNAVVVGVSPTNVNHGFAAPMTSLPGGSLTPTRAASGAARPQVSSLSVRIGTNDFDIDAATLQAIFVVRNDLQRALPSLQALNGTSPTPTNSVPPPFFNSGVTNFAPIPLTNRVAFPLTNMVPF